VKHLSKSFLKRLEEQEKLRVLEEYHRFLAAQDLLPPPRTLLLRRFAVLLEGLGGILLGMAIATVALFCSFVLFNLLLHLGA
jgi:hypothetical protein